MFKLLLFGFIVGIAFGQSPDELPLLNITQGSVSGLVADDGNYYQFYGIPYADSTSGSHRFKAPTPAPNFNDTFIADRKGIKCVHALGVGFEGTEDCLVLDIFTPSLNSTELLPVMVWIKGNEFETDTEPEVSFRTLVEKDVVVVSLNFRESILGFLCLGTETAPGNAGLKDIIAGLRWLQENIVYFGGDANRVTLFGHGTGAAAVDLVTLSPMSEGLVHRAISQSGSSMAPWSVTRDPTKYAVIVAEALGHTITNVEELSDIFSRTSVSALMAVINDLDLTDNSLSFAPCIENDALEGEKFLVKSPYSTVIDGDYLQIPFMIGFVENEGTIREEKALENDWLERMDVSFSEFIQSDLDFNTIEDATIVSEQIRSFYFNEETINLESISEYILYQGDTMIIVSALREARLRATSSINPVYLYQFSYEGSLGDAFKGSLSLVGATHSEELAYLFDINSASEINALDATVRQTLVERWTNFAKTGEPTSDTSSVIWQPVTSETINVLVIRNIDEENDENLNNIEIGLTNPRQNTLSFWDEIYAEHFIDPEGVWGGNNRDDEDEEITTDDPLVEVGGTTEDPTNAGEEPEEESELTNSASTAVAYTLGIIALFGIVNFLHLSQMLSE